MFYGGHEYDGETGLSYMNARYYNGKIGRFVSQDPLVFNNPEKFLNDPQGLNTYSYVKNNPLRYVDPTGKLWKEFLEEVSLNTVGFMTATLPIFSDLRDSIELRTGRDMISNQQLTQEEKDLTGMGLFVPAILSSKEIRMGNNGFKKVNAGIEKSIKNNISAIEYNIQDHLTERDIQGLMRDISGNPVWFEREQRYFNHQKEVFIDGIQGVEKRVNTLNKYIKEYNLSDKQKEAINNIVEKAGSYMERIDKIMKSHGR